MRERLRWALLGAVSLTALGCERSGGAPSSAPAPVVAQAASSEAGERQADPVVSSAPTAPERITGAGKAMGTHLVYAAFTNERVDAAAVRRAFDAATAEIVRLEDLMTTWRDSELSRVNAAAGKEAVKVGAETLMVVQKSIEASEFSKGTFDITFETLHGLWKFDEDLEPVPPEPKALAKRLKAVGYRHIQVDATAQTIRLDHPDTRISLGGIAKGYAVDRAAQVLRDAGVASFYVQAGGDLYAEGLKPDGTPWTAGIRDPRGTPQEFFAVVALENHAFSTAGDYERSYIVGGKRYHHILDPRTGYPATACRSVTVWAKTALLADAVDDAVFILGPKEGLALVESLDDVGAVIVDAKNEVWISKRLQGKIQITAAPSDGI